MAQPIGVPEVDLDDFIKMIAVLVAFCLAMAFLSVLLNALPKAVVL